MCDLPRSASSNSNGELCVNIAIYSTVFAIDNIITINNIISMVVLRNFSRGGQRGHILPLLRMTSPCVILNDKVMIVNLLNEQQLKFCPLSIPKNLFTPPGLIF